MMPQSAMQPARSPMMLEGEFAGAIDRAGVARCALTRNL